MRIARVSVQNFRCLSSTADDWAIEWQPNDDLNLLIGPNGAGKTALVDAIDLVLNREGRANRALVTEYDFPCCDTAKTISIEVALVDIGTAIGRFADDIQFLDKTKLEPIDETNETPDENKHQRGVIIRFEAKLDEEEGEIRWTWILPKFTETVHEEKRELSRSQHEGVDYFRIQPSISAGAFTLGEYSVLGRHLRRLKYKLGKLPDRLKPTQSLPECKWDCKNCADQKCCTNEVENDHGKAPDARPLGKLLDAITGRAKSMLGANAWSDMKNSLGPRYGGLRSGLATTTVGLRSPETAVDGFIPFERLSAGEKYALSFALATTRLTGSSTPIIIMEEPETALYPAAIGQIMANLQAASSPQVIVTSHSESVIRRFALNEMFLMNSGKAPVRLGHDVQGGDRLGVEALVAPGRTSALLAERVIVAEGLQDAIVSRDIDRLTTEVRGPQAGFAANNWCFFDAGGAPNAESKAKLLKKWGKSVVILFDGDAEGTKCAEATRNQFPIFMYRSSNGETPVLETALLNGLPAAQREEAEKAFWNNSRCQQCKDASTDIADCLSHKSCASSVEKRERKRRLCSCCIEQYRGIKKLPPAFASLLDKLDDARPGCVVMLDFDYREA